MNMKKTRNVNNPYAIFRVGDYEIRVLKTYKNPESEIKTFTLGGTRPQKALTLSDNGNTATYIKVKF